MNILSHISKRYFVLGAVLILSALNISSIFADGGDFVTVGTAEFSAGQTYFTSLTIDSNNIPYIAYPDGGNNDKATVMKFNGSAWVNVGGGGGFSRMSTIYLPSSRLQ